MFKLGDRFELTEEQLNELCGARNHNHELNEDNLKRVCSYIIISVDDLITFNENKMDKIIIYKIANRLTGKPHFVNEEYLKQLKKIN